MPINDEEALTWPQHRRDRPVVEEALETAPTNRTTFQLVAFSLNGTQTNSYLRRPQACKWH